MRYHTQQDLVPEIRQLPEQEAHIWTVRFDAQLLRRLSNGTILQVEEAERAARYRFVEDRSRFVARRTALRSILSAYLGLSPEVIRITKSDRGRPELADQDLRERLDFNVSSTSDMAMIAVSRSTIGVDIESLRRDVDIDGIARTWFASSEIACISSGVHGSAVQGFLSHWTVKEAYLKATGHGIPSLPRIRVECRPESAVWWDEERDTSVIAKAIPVSLHHAAAVVGDLMTTRMFAWEGL